MLEEDVTRNLDEQVDDVEDGQRPVEAHALVEVQVVGQALDARIADVDAVEEAEHVQHRDQRHRVPINLAPERRLFLLGPFELGVGSTEV